MPFVAYRPHGYLSSTTAHLTVNRTLTKQMHRFLARRADQAGWPYPHLKGVRDRWGMPYALGHAADPIWRLTGNVPQRVAHRLSVHGFHAPHWFSAQLTGTSDSPFVVIDTTSGWTLWGGRASVTGPRRIHVTDAGCFSHHSNGLDKRAGGAQENYRTRGIISDAMVIRRDLLTWAVKHHRPYPHVLHMFWCETDTAAGHRFPLVNCEQHKHGWGAQGLRIGIGRNVDLTTRHMSATGLALARGLQRHGCYLGDSSGGETSLKLEQTSTRHNPWHGFPIGPRELHGITWEDFVVYR